MTFVYITRPGFFIRTTNINIQKIDYLFLKTYKIAITKFLLQNRLKIFDSLKKLFICQQQHKYGLKKAFFLF